MTDPTPTLVERLRSVDISWSETGEWCAEAADYIEYLEARLEVAPGWGEDCDGIGCRDETIRLQDARIARLTEELARTERNRDMWKGQCERQASELTQLRAKADVLAGALGALVGEELGGDSHDGWRSHDAYRPVITWHDRRVARQALQAWNGEAE